MRNVRNFWIELDVDGKQTRVECGPQAKNGGFQLKVYIRDEGESVKAMYLQGIALNDGGKLLLMAASNYDLNDHIAVETQR
jgi:hypothetical protein